MAPARSKSVREFEPYINSTVRGLLRKWDDLCDKAAKAQTSSKYGDKLKGYAVVETLDWYNALAFDIIGDLAFGAPFDMIERDGADTVAITREDGTIFCASSLLAPPRASMCKAFLADAVPRSQVPAACRFSTSAASTLRRSAASRPGSVPT